MAARSHFVDGWGEGWLWQNMCVSSSLFRQMATLLHGLIQRPGLALQRCCCGMVMAGLSSACGATDVALAGVFPGKALLVVNGGAPRAINVGTATQEGVRIVAVEGDAATLDFDGRRHRLFVGERAINVIGRSGVTGSVPVVTIQPDGRGQYRSTGAVNGASMLFIIDTGATFVSLGRSDALKAGVDYTKGEPVLMQTANGVARAWRISLDTVRVGDVTLRNVEGVVHAKDMPIALLGMSFLNRMEMRRDGSSLLLKQRY